MCAEARMDETGSPILTYARPDRSTGCQVLGGDPHHKPRQKQHLARVELGLKFLYTQQPFDLIARQKPFL